MKFAVLVLTFLSVLSVGAFDLTPYKKIVCFGDSITHGGYYPMFLQCYLAETDPAHPRRVINRGISGDTVPKLLKRVDRMLKEDQPDLVIVMVGINDLMFTTRFAEKDLPFETAVEKYPVFKRFEKNLGQLLDVLNQAGVKVVLLATAPYNESANPGMRSKVKANMDSTGVKNLLVIERRLAGQKGAVWIDIHAPMLKNLRENDDKFPRGKADRVHPSRSEHLIIAGTIIGKPYKPGKKLVFAERCRAARKEIKEVRQLLNSFPKGCTTPEARIALLEKQVEKSKGKSYYQYMRNMLPKRIAIVKDPDAKLKSLQQQYDAAFQKLYEK